MIPGNGDKEFYDTIPKGEEIKINGKSKKKSGSETLRKDPAFFGANAYMSYPIARSNSEKTGDTLRITCVEYTPPKDGAHFGFDLLNSTAEIQYKTKDGDTKTKTILATNEILSEYKISDGNGKFKTPTREDYFDIDEDTGKAVPMSFSANFTDANTRVNANKKTKYNIELPMPQEVNDSNQVTWGDDSMNALELAGLAVAQKFMKNGAVEGIQQSQQAIRAFLSGVNLPDIKESTQNAMRAAISGAAVGALGSNISAQSVIARSTGQILNSNLELLFQGVNLRSFPYSITFSPRSPKESDVVKAIIRSLKMSMAPKAGEYNGSAQGIFLQSPDLFQLKYLKDGEEHPFLNKMKLTALTGMNINYTNAGTYASYEDGTPVNIRMDLTFKEINPIYFEDYLPGHGAGQGVGY